MAKTRVTDGKRATAPNLSVFKANSMNASVKFMARSTRVVGRMVGQSRKPNCDKCMPPTKRIAAATIAAACQPLINEMKVMSGAMSGRL
jgi:hypothetical protein